MILLPETSCKESLWNFLTLLHDWLTFRSPPRVRIQLAPASSRCSRKFHRTVCARRFAPGFMKSSASSNSLRSASQSCKNDRPSERPPLAVRFSFREKSARTGSIGLYEQASRTVDVGGVTRVAQEPPKPPSCVLQIDWCSWCPGPVTQDCATGTGPGSTVTHIRVSAHDKGSAGFDKWRLYRRKLVNEVLWRLLTASLFRTS